VTGANRRALGLVLQLVGALTAVEPLRRVITPERAFDRDHGALALAGLAVLQIAVGWIIARRPARSRLAALGFVAGAIAAAIWVLLPHELADPQADLMETVTSSSPTLIHVIATVADLLAWPIAVLVAVWRAPTREPEATRRRPEAGGVLIAYGVTVLVTATLGGIGLVLDAGKSWNPYPFGLIVEMLATRVVEAGIALLALRAGTELVMGTQHGRARITTFVWAAVIALSLVAITDVALFAFVMPRDDSAAITVALLLVGIAGKLALPLLVRAHAAPIARNAIEVGAPDAEAAVRPLFWLVLWFGVTIAAKLVSIFDRRFRSRDVIPLAIALLLIAACGAAFREFARRGKRERRVATILAILASALLVLTVGFNLNHGLRNTTTLMFLVAFAVIPWAIVWLERPSLRDQRGLGSVFE